LKLLASQRAEVEEKTGITERYAAFVGYIITRMIKQMKAVGNCLQDQ